MAIQALKKALQDYESVIPKCGNCEMFQGTCLVHQAMPPEDWIKNQNDCQDWIYDGIPF